MEKVNRFRIGISMAGAISAGAYTAGVMDYLLEALENWQKAKDLKLPGVPKHEVIIEVLSGASAGGMTAVITSAALQKDFPHINQLNYKDKLTKENPFFDFWVNLTEESNNDMMSQMLGTEDITSRPDNPDKEVRSVFNSLFIEKIARRTIDSTGESAANREYIASDMELFTTITNLRGFEYNLEFKTATGTRNDRMSMHKDIVHFQLNPSGTYKNDGKIPFHFQTSQGLNKKLLIDAAIATGAFPVGLAPHVVVRDPKYINDNPLLKISHSSHTVVDPLKDYNTVCVDGGLINNEPYDITEKILSDRRKAETGEAQGNGPTQQDPDARTASKFDTTILMIDPFPNYNEKTSAVYHELQAVKFSVLQIFGAMRHQLTVKTDLLEQAYNDDDYSRFMIAPIRTKEGTTQDYSIACGSLEGFGGFFSKQFRIHDYMLGRRNCQRFIQNYFCVPAGKKNPIIEYGYKNLDENSIEFFKKSGRDSLPIIPDIRLSADNLGIAPPKEEMEFDYPQISLKYLLGLEKKVQDRFNSVFNNISNGKNPEKKKKKVNGIIERIRKKSWFKRNIISPVGTFTAEKILSIAKSLGKDFAAEKFIDEVISDMSMRGLLNEDC